MRGHKLYEKLSNIISQSALNNLSDMQVEALEEELSKLVQEKNGDIDEISYDDLLCLGKCHLKLTNLVFDSMD